MRITKIEPNSNGSHDNQSGGHTLPDGWAVVPDILETPNFPFGDITVSAIDGIPTVINWVAGEMPIVPEPETPEPELTLTDVAEIAFNNAVEIETLKLIGGE